MNVTKRVKQQQGGARQSIISFKDDIPNGAKFVRTRHKSIRCFPFCSPIHKSNSFCGNPLYVTITDDLIFSIENDEVINLIGEFRKIEEERSYDLDDVYTTDKALIQARLFKREGNKAYFIFMPPGKWTYQSKLKPTDRHVFSVYYILQGICKALQDSNSFQIIPVWKLGPSEKDSGYESSSEHETPPVRSHEIMTPAPLHQMPSPFLLSSMEQQPPSHSFFPSLQQRSFPIPLPTQRGGFVASSNPFFSSSSVATPTTLPPSLYPLLPRPFLLPSSSSTTQHVHHQYSSLTMPTRPPQQQVRPPYNNNSGSGLKRSSSSGSKTIN